MGQPQPLDSISDAPSPARKWASVVLLTLVSVFNILDRFLPSILIEPIKHDLQLTDTAIGLINGFGFLVVYAVVGVPLARLSDRGRYGLVIGLCLTLWSTMTMVGGMVQSGLQLALARMGVALGEAGSAPAAHAYISRHFPPDKRSAPLAVLTMSVPVGVVLALMAGGLVGERLGWRFTFLLVGGIGLLLAPAVLLLLGVRSAGVPAAATPGASGGSLADFRKGSFLFLLAGVACIGIGGYALSVFGPAYLIRVQGLSLAQVGVQFGLLVGGIGILSLVVMGFAADRLSARDPRWLLWSVSVMIVLVIPVMVVGFRTSDPVIAMIALAVANINGTAYAAPVISALHRLVAPGYRATASATMLVCAALIGGAGPLAVGMASDALTPTHGTRALGLALLIVPAIHLVGAGCFALAARRFREQSVPAPVEEYA